MTVRNRRIVYTAIAITALLAGPFLRPQTIQARSTIAGTALPVISGCVAMNRWASQWTPTFAAPDYSLADSYQCDGFRLHVSIVQYVQQQQGKEAVGEFNSVIPRAWWNSTTLQRRTVADGVTVDEYRVDRPDAPMTIWNWYAVGKKPAASPFEVKALEAWNALRFDVAPTSNITVAIEGDPAATATVLETSAERIWAWFGTRHAAT